MIDMSFVALKKRNSRQFVANGFKKDHDCFKSTGL